MSIFLTIFSHRHELFRWNIFLTFFLSSTQAIYHDFFSRAQDNQISDTLQTFVHVERKIIMTRDMHFVIKFYNKHHVSSTSFDFIESNDERIALNRERDNSNSNSTLIWELDYEIEVDVLIERIEQRRAIRARRKRIRKARVIQNDDDEKSIRAKQKSTQIEEEIRTEKETIKTRTKTTKKWVIR